MPGGQQSSGSSAVFNPTSLPFSEIHAILYTCHNEGACDSGPKYLGRGQVPSSISTGDMLKVYKYACEDNDFPVCSSEYVSAINDGELLVVLL